MKVFFIFLLILLAGCATARHGIYEDNYYAVASWYGSDFHGRPTSSGEIFNMYALTCAHKEYPFGTELKITSVSTNKTVCCRVNDRGPFVKGRDIDLSYAAAKEIGIIEQGVGKVKIEHIGRDSRYIKEVTYSSDTGPFTIQVGSFRELSNAERLKDALKLKYSKIYIIKTEIKGDEYYRVRIGKFYAKDKVYKIAKRLADEGYNVFITTYTEKI
ncbi:MAG: septal ring lytic transglycosylase RlpA family protein [Nitrospirota bacterium]